MEQINNAADILNKHKKTGKHSHESVLKKKSLDTLHCILNNLIISVSSNGVPSFRDEKYSTAKGLSNMRSQIRLCHQKSALEMISLYQ